VRSYAPPVPFSVAQVTPWPWEQHHEVNRFVERLSDELCARGHRVVVVAPSDSPELVREGRAKVERLGTDVDAVFDEPGCASVLAVGQSLPFRRGGSVSLPLDVSRTLEELLERAELDFVHVHEPFAPSASSAALRHSRALNVGTFHSTTERFVSTQVARRMVQRLFGRLDGRTASFAATRDLIGRYFPGDYRVINPGADLLQRPRADSGTPEIVFSAEEERGALRVFLRALRRLDLDLPWEATVVSAQGPSSSTPLRAELRERVRFTTNGEDAAVACADILVAASAGPRPAPALVMRAIAAGAIPVLSRLPVYEELADEDGLLFAPADTEVLAGQLRRLITDPALRDRLREGAPTARSWSALADEVEASYRRVVARRHDPTGDPELWASMANRKLIDVDLHMHTDHSGDCATPVEHLLATAREQGLGAIAITDHNEVSGAFEAAAKAAEFGIKIIIAEEVKTASQGEVIGLFLKEKIPRGLTLEETVAEIKRQGGLVYVPHPFDRMHAVPDYEHLLKIIDDVDAIEVYNPRVAIGSFNEEAERFAAKYQIVRGAGSDSHVAAGLGSVRIRMRDFDGPAEFLESLRHAEISTKSGTLLYVQALKFLETKATPRAARRARRDRRIRRAARKG
jgi:glycosyltransferase involved in cell wall biosynthesis